MNFLRTLRPVVLLGAVASAAAQQIPPPEAGQQIVNVGVINGQVRMRDRETDAPLLDVRGVKLHQATNPSSLAPSVTVNKQPAGFDIIYRFNNTTTEPKSVGDFQVGIITLGDTIRNYDFRQVSTPVQIKWDTYINGAGWYPDDLYSPVAVLTNQQHAIGVSLLYPILEYKHDAQVAVCKMPNIYEAGEGGRGWMVAFGSGGQWPGLVPPGEERTYVVAVRVTKDPQEWVRTLLPYRTYFRSQYGGVQYQREVEPVMGISIAMQGSAAANPSGWVDGARRPDVHGWIPWVKYITVNMNAYKRFMLWAPSGVYNQNVQNNFPFQFTTRWMVHPKVKTAIDPVIGLPKVKAKGKTLGLWWGRSLQVAGEWNTGQLHPLDLHNPADVAAGMAELDLAIQAGATLIGMDSFVHSVMPVWDEVEWVQQMAQRGQGLKFAFEPSACDIMHRLGPITVDAFIPSTLTPHVPEDFYFIKHPNYLADFLLPGHETWALMHWECWYATTGQWASAQRMRQDVIKVASFGYVPVILGEIAQPSQQFRAAESWEQSVPIDLQGWPIAPGGEPGAGLPKGSSRFYDRAELLRALERAEDNDPP